VGEFAGGVVDHVDQADSFSAAPFQPVVIGSVPLHQFAARTPPLAPHMHCFDLAPTALPQLRFQHDFAQCLAPDLNLVAAGQVLRRQRRAEAVVHLLRENPHHRSFSLRLRLDVRPRSP